MPKTERVLALDFGASSLKIGEFEYAAEGRPILVDFAFREYGEELTDENRAAVSAAVLREALLEKNFTASRALVSISGQSVFLRFVKLPPVAEDESRVRQIVEFEARQNVPFPIEEVIWDYQLLTNPDAEELEVLFVVVRNEIVQQITDVVQAVGLDVLTVEIAPIACYNAARANHVGDEACAMVLNIGGRSTSLLFADRERFFARTIPIAGHSITQQIAKEFGIGLEEAEELKRRHGFVALGGAYEEPESEVAAAVSKIVRNVMARLHGEINRSISVYRAQHKGRRPTEVYLAGGSSIMAFTDHFFAEKLRMEVGYLNPFQVIDLGPDVDRRQLQDVAHTFSEIIGLGLRYRIECPVEISLVPESIRRQQTLKQKKPYVVACMTVVLLYLFLLMLATERKAGFYEACYHEGEGLLGRVGQLHEQIKKEVDATAQAQSNYKGVEEFLKKRTVWPRILNEIQRLKPADVWLVSVRPLRSVQAEAAVAPGGMGMGAAGAGPGMGMPGGGGGMMMGPEGAGGGMMMGPGAPGGGGGGMMMGPEGGGGMMMGPGAPGGGEAAGPGGGGGGMEMGMGAMGGMGAAPGAGPAGGLGGAAGGVSGDMTYIEGFELAGYSVDLPEEENEKGSASAGGSSGKEGKGEAGTTAQDSEAGPKEGKEKESADKSASSDEAALPGLGSGDEQNGLAAAPGGENGGMDAGDEEEEAPESTATPEALFLSRLRKSELFDADKTFTRFKYYKTGTSIENTCAFVMQVKLSEPIDWSSE